MASNPNNQNQGQGQGPPKLPPLYAHLLPQNANPDATIVRAPVMYGQAGNARSTPAFQPRVINRPQQPQNKNKNKTAARKVPTAGNSSSSPAMPTAAALIGPKTTSLAEFTKNNSNNNSHNYYQANRPWRGRGKKGKKNAKRQYDEEEEPKEVDWDAIYDPAKPTSWKAWNISAEKYDSAYEWKEKLNQKPKPSLSSESPASTSEGPDAKRQRLSVSATPHFPQRSTSSSEEPAMRSGLGATPSQAEEQTLGVVTPEEQATRSGPSTTLPGKEGFARRMMEKMGHVKGKGLGLNQDGITQPLVHKKLGNIAVIKGGGRAKKAEDGPNGKRSEVVVVYGLLDGVDSEDDEARNDGGIRQEIGDYCANKFGILQKVHPFWGGKHAQAPVFLKFASEFDALMAVDHFNDPTKAGAFRGKQTTAKFYNLENFEHGVYE